MLSVVVKQSAEQAGKLVLLHISLSRPGLAGMSGKARCPRAEPPPNPTAALCTAQFVDVVKNHRTLHTTQSCGVLPAGLQGPIPFDSDKHMPILSYSMASQNPPGNLLPAGCVQFTRHTAAALPTATSHRARQVLLGISSSPLWCSKPQAFMCLSNS